MCEMQCYSSSQSQFNFSFSKVFKKIISVQFQYLHHFSYSFLTTQLTV